MGEMRLIKPYLFGFAGTLPFLWGLLSHFVPFRLPEHLIGENLQITYGIVIFAYMSGTHWNFAALLNGGESTSAYIYAVVPALFLFAVMLFARNHVHLCLIIAFPALLCVDRYFANRGVTPHWWMNLRLWLSGIVTLSLLVTFITS